jgi:hypothetical protein
MFILLTYPLIPVLLSTATCISIPASSRAGKYLTTLFNPQCYTSLFLFTLPPGLKSGAHRLNTRHCPIPLTMVIFVDMD